MDVTQLLWVGHFSTPAHLHKAGANGYAFNPLVRSHRNECCHHVAISALRSTAQLGKFEDVRGKHLRHAACA